MLVRKTFWNYYRTFTNRIAGLAHAGLKVVKPQEALVLTLFGNYTGTIKEPGFYFVNPFSVAVNPANHTRLGQSGDVSTKSPFRC